MKTNSPLIFPDIQTHLLQTAVWKRIGTFIKVQCHVKTDDIPLQKLIKKSIWKNIVFLPISIEMHAVSLWNEVRVSADMTCRFPVSLYTAILPVLVS